jgi:hypothetical protein
MSEKGEPNIGTSFDVGKDFFKPVSTMKMVEKDLPDALNETSDKAVEKITKFTKAAESVLVKARDGIDNFMKKNPGALPGAVLVAGSLVLWPFQKPLTWRTDMWQQIQLE